jgi:hypothetical protein
VFYFGVISAYCLTIWIQFFWGCIYENEESRFNSSTWNFLLYVCPVNFTLLDFTSLFESLDQYYYSSKHIIIRDYAWLHDHNDKLYYQDKYTKIFVMYNFRWCRNSASGIEGMVAVAIVAEIHIIRNKTKCN